MTRGELTEFLGYAGNCPASDGAMPKIVEVKVFDPGRFFSSVEGLPQRILADGLTFTREYEIGAVKAG
jgi:hypothetical protein